MRDWAQKNWLTLLFLTIMFFITWVVEVSVNYIF